MSWQPTYEFKVERFRADKYYDGDSFWLFIKRSFRDDKTIKCRLKDVDTWEIRKSKNVDDEHKAKGLLAKSFTGDFFVSHLEQGHVVWVRTHSIQEWDSFGRVLCEVFVDLPDGTTITLAEELRKNGHEKVV
jgi:endonuclease YncB( thermonuclease family)